MARSQTKAAAALGIAALLASCAAPAALERLAPQTFGDRVSLPVSFDVVPNGKRRLAAQGDCDIPIAGGYELDDIASMAIHVDYPGTPTVHVLDGLNGSLDASSTVRLSDLQPNATATVWIQAYGLGSELTVSQNETATSLLDTRFGVDGANHVRPLAIAQRLKIKFKPRPVVGNWQVNGYSDYPGVSKMRISLADLTATGPNLPDGCLQASSVSGDLIGTSGAAIFGNLIVGHVYLATLESYDGSTPIATLTTAASFTLDPNYMTSSSGTLDFGQIDVVATPALP
ncbi:MAG: hypothetical protein VKP62_15800 [Candidatus Sericytochromatia bacterium]|nr:hypothetical protein [Candidatus Sericytochromatia bacterium]